MRVRAWKRGDRWVTSWRLYPGWSAFVAAGDVVDKFGNTNGARSVTVSG
jgi:hypothetical protein